MVTNNGTGSDNQPRVFSHFTSIVDKGFWCQTYKENMSVNSRTKPHAGQVS